MLSLVLVAMLGVIPTAEEAAAPAGSIEITQANVEFGSTVYLLVAVDYTDAYASLDEAKANITISIDGKVLTPDESVEAPEGTVGFKYTDLGAKNMGDVLEIKAYNGETEADSITYSILEYSIKAKATNSDDEYLMEVVDAMIEFGAAAQAAFEYAGDYDLSGEYSLIVANGAEVKKQIVAVGESVTLTPSAAVGADAYLCNAEFDIISSTFEAEAGYQRYYYLASSRATDLSLNLNWYTGDKVETYFNYKALTGDDTHQNLKEFNVASTIGTKTATVTPHKSTKANWQVSGGTATGNLLTVSSNNVTKVYDHGYRYVEPGILYINTNIADKSVDKDNINAYGAANSKTYTSIVDNVSAAGYNFNNQTTKMPNVVDADGVCTVTFTLKLGTGQFFEAPRLRGTKIAKANAQNGKDTDTYFYLWQKLSPAGQPNNSGVSVSGSTEHYIQLSKTEWTTFHIVIDSKANTLYLYDVNGTLVDMKADYLNNTNFISKNGTIDFSTPEKFMTSNATYWNWYIGPSVSGGIQKIIFTKGNIFN